MNIERRRNAPVVLVIAGFDPSGGAGIIADIQTIEALSCTAVAAVASITFQNTHSYSGALHQSAASMRAQIQAILAEHEIAAVKVGMLPTPEIVREVAQLMREADLPNRVVDPVMETTSGGQLMEEDAFAVFVAELLPLARIVTPNIPEAEKLAGLNITDEDSMRQAAGRIRELGARAVLIKGGHLKEDAGARRKEPRNTERWALDLVDDHGEVTVFKGEWFDGPNVRGTGCMLSSAIACGLAKGDELIAAIETAKQFVARAIQNSTSQIQK